MPTEPRELYDVVIVGAGPAGLSAGMYCARQGLATAIVAGEIGGQAGWAGKIENYLGWQLITGPDLVQRFREHAGAFGVDCFEGQLVNAIVPEDDDFIVLTREGLTLRGHAVILATGRAPKRLAVPGEQELLGKGVSYCATCDAAFFRGKQVAVVGTGESAADASLQLADLGAKVALLAEEPVRAPEPVLARLRDSERVLVLEGVSVTRIDGNGRVSSVGIRFHDADETLPVEGVFIETGSIPVAEFTGGLVELNDAGEVVVDKRGATSVPGVYAAGDITDSLGKQVIIAAGEGARAAVAVQQDLKRR